MFTTRHLHLAHVEVLRWLAILTLASLLAALAARMAAGGDATSPALEPRLLPAATLRLAKPMGVGSNPAATEPQFDAALKLWKILAYQKDGNFEQAVEEWPNAPLSCEAEVWRHVSLAQAQLGFRDFSAALASLDAALALDHQNAVVPTFAASCVWNRPPRLVSGTMRSVRFNFGSSRPAPLNRA